MFWSEDNWDRFLSDMILVSSENKDYFLGSLILKQKETPSNSQIGDIRIVVDGQQRLTTLTIFFKVLCAAQEREEDFNRQFINRAKEVILKHNHNDIEVFNAIMNDALTSETRDNNQDSCVLKCYDYFVSKQSDLKDLNFDYLLNKIYFVGIDLGKEEDEQQIFDTINSLGVSLTTAELLKNELFDRNDEGFFNQTWKVMFEDDNKSYWEQEVTSGKRANIDLLLQTYLFLKSDADQDSMIIKSLFQNYKTLFSDTGIKEDKAKKDDFINGLIDYALIYKANINPHLTIETIDAQSPIDRLNLIIFGLNTTTIIPYIIYILKEVQDEQERNKIFSLMENYLIRRVVCRESSKNYNKFFSALIRNKVKSYDGLLQKITMIENPQDLMPDDSVFKKGFLENKITNQQAKTVLYLIEASIRDNAKSSTKILGLDQYSLEHVMPKKWRNNWDNNLDDAHSRIRDQKLLTLGNLTIITFSLNSSIKDASWENKKTGRNGKSGLIECSQGIKILERERFLDTPIWDESSIEERANFLYEQAKAVWPYEDAAHNILDRMSA